MKGATFVKETQYENMYGTGVVYEWDQKGLQDNFYYETVVSGDGETAESHRVMVEINQVPDDIQYFDPATYTTKFDQSVLDLPAKCSIKKTCSWLSTCTAVRVS